MLTVPPEEAAARIRAGAPVVDVRAPAQNARAALPGSTNLPFAAVAAGAIPAGAGADTELYVVCEVGSFSELAAAHLRAAGLAGARSVRGGLAALRPLLGDQSDGR